MKISIVWNTEDVIEQAKNRNIKITTKEANKILRNIKRYHDCCVGINWDVIDCHLDQLLVDRDNLYVDRPHVFKKR
jgi:hypothetical protein